MRSTHRVSQGFVSACLGGSLPYFWFFIFALWHVGHTSWTVVWRPFQSKCWQRVCSVRVSPGWQSISWYQSTVFYLCHLEPACGRTNHCKAPQFKRIFPFRGIVYGPIRSTHSVYQVFVSACLGGSLPYFWLVFNIFGMFGISYTRRGLLCEVLYGQNFDGGCALFEYLLYNKSYHDTNL